MDKIINISTIICIFLAVYAIRTPIIDFYYYYFLVIFLLPYLVIKIQKIPTKIFIVFLVILVLGLINIMLSNTTLSNTIKYWLGPLIVFHFYYYIIAYKKFNFEKIFRIYLLSAFWIAVIGLIQVLSHKVGFQAGYDFSWLGQERSYGDSVYASDLGFAGLYNVHSIFSEPSHFGQGLAAAIFFSIYTLICPTILNRPQAVVILLASVLTQSSTTYFTILVSILLIIINYSKPLYMIFAGLVIFLGGTYLLTNVQKFQDRVSSLNMVATEGFNSNIEDGIDGSTLILANHFHVAFENMKYHPLIGTGIGSHEFAYEKYSLTKGLYIDDLKLNVHDASSMFNRIMSEMGLLGLLSIVIFIGFNFLKRKKNNTYFGLDNYWAYNNASLVVVLTFLLRQGHFFIYGFPLFVLTYYYTNKIYNYSVKNINI